jgi:exodeoxyribonuclease VII small subunit
VKNDLTYSEAFYQLQQLVGELEDGNIQLEELAAKVRHANELIAICENKLRSIELEINDNGLN